jgi:Fic family protein
MAQPRITGEYIQGQSFVPQPLPPANPSLQLEGKVLELYGEAMSKLGSLNEMANRIPDQDRFLKAYILKESILTSDIEGIHTTLLEVLSMPYGIATNDKNSQLVINYSKALEYAIKLIRDEDMPIVARVLKEAHAKLLIGEGDRSSPGEFRKQQVKVGGLIPAPANLIGGLISDLEKFINNDSSLPSLIKAGLAHVQFETIHPFLDGNGRIGRLLIVLILIRDKILTQPLLYPSYFFKKHHAEYYAKLDGVRTHGDFESWIEYYLKAIAESAEDATKNAREIEQLEKKLLLDIQASGLFIRSLSDAHKFLSHLFKHPVVTIIDLADKLNKPYNSIKQMVEKFEQLNILHKHSWTKRNKTYKFSKYIELLGL